MDLPAVRSETDQYFLQLTSQTYQTFIKEKKLKKKDTTIDKFCLITYRRCGETLGFTLKPHDETWLALESSFIFWGPG